MNPVTSALPLGAIARDHLFAVEQGTNGDAPYDTRPRGCRCDGGPLRDVSEPWFVVCHRCGAVLSVKERPR